MRLWSFAQYDLHLSKDDFYALTPRQFQALSKRHQARTESNEFLFAQLTAYTVNTSMMRPEKAAHPRDFMPSQWLKVAPTPVKPTGRTRMSKQRRVDVANCLRLGFAD